MNFSENVIFNILLMNQFGFDGSFQQHLGGTLLLFLGAGALQAEMSGKGSDKIYLKRALFIEI